MNVNLLAVSVGNTRTRIGRFLDGELSDHLTIENGQFERIAASIEASYGPLRDKPSRAVVLASVNPSLADRVAKRAADQLGSPVLRVEQDLPIPIGRQLDPETIVGEDRLLNAAAAHDVLKQACVLVDAGTAFTVDFVDGAGTFHGGAIAPGAQMMLASLHRHTAQLPQVTFDRPTESIGHNTVQAMRAAVFYGLRGMVRELVEQYAQLAGAYPMVVATGGDAELLFADFPLIDRVVPDLTLRGMAVTLQASIPAES